MSLAILLERLSYWSTAIIQFHYWDNPVERLQLMIAIDQFNQATIDARTVGLV